ncbi:hypothetical protein KDE13_07505 [Campylobacter sp. faydin G-140]|uniref:hypothetical protein n=1 Tax=Campylobacter anatolicus TaxID=2829105 RepID=UPI001B9663F7|nr:hypothetical protein [Campylobacter anatolicus]MBR8466183.1 hypothetical protein [Campylobacter anatolicus]
MWQNLLNGVTGALKSGWEWLGGVDKNGTSNALTALGTLGNIYGGYEQNKMAKKMYGMQKDAYDFNKILSQREIARQNQAQQILNNACANSSLANGYDDKGR